MPISGSQKALMLAFAGVARAGATRSGYGDYLVIPVQVQVTINSVDLSAYVTAVEIDDGYVPMDRTVFGNVTRTIGGGIGDWTVRVKARQDFGSSAWHSQILPLLNLNTTIVINRNSQSLHPQWTGTGRFRRYTPLKTKAGEDPEVELEFGSTGTFISVT
jgi:hypothetical protein